MAYLGFALGGGGGGGVGGGPPTTGFLYKLVIYVACIRVMTIYNF